jgi:hypothetical protein
MLPPCRYLDFDVYDCRYSFILTQLFSCSPFSAINDESRNFDERYFNGEGPFNDNRETDGVDTTMTISANRLYRVRDNIIPSQRVLMPEYDSLLNYTYLSYFGQEMKSKGYFTKNATALEIMDDYPPYIANFNLTSKCSLNTMMCCYTENRLGDDFEDNADVCYHDLEKSYFSNNVRHGYGVFDPEYPAYCTAFHWDEDESSASYQYRGNALFDISFGTFLRKGYVKNIPGAPMCSCIESMPVVSNAACRKLDVSNEHYTLKYDGKGIKIVQDNVQVSFSDCGQDFLSYHSGKASPEIVEKLNEHITPSCAMSRTKTLNQRFLISGSTNQFDLPDPTKWKQFAGRGTSFYPTKTTDLSILDSEFRTQFALSPNKIVYRHCPRCIVSHRHVYYRRITPLPGQSTLNFLDLFLSNWISKNNVINVDFELYSTYEDAMSRTNKWTYCNYDEPSVGFPRDCGVTAYTPCQWNSYKKAGCGTVEYNSRNHAFYVEL